MLGIELSSRSGVPYYRQVQDQIAESIRAGRLEAGTRLPSVRSLSAGLMVSAITIRRAYTELESSGLIERQQGRGTFVAEQGGAAAEQHAHREARDTLTRAVDTACALGLAPSDVRAVVDQHLVKFHKEEK